MSKQLKTIISTGLIALLPILVSAQGVTPQPAPGVPSEPLTIQRILGILNTLINWAFTILMVLATFFIFYAAYLYLTAAGDAEKVKSAQQVLIYAAVGIAVAFVAQGVRFLVEQLVR